MLHDPVYFAVLAFLILQSVAVFGRVVIRAGIVKAFGWDDVAAIATLVLACAFDIILLVANDLSNGPQPLFKIPGKHLKTVINLVLSAELCYIAGTTVLKIALGLLLLRVLVKRWMRWTIFAIMATSVVYGLIYFFIILFQCGNPELFFQSIIRGQCLSQAKINGTSYCHAILTAGADIIYGLLPVIFLWNAEFSKRAKWSIGGILILGSLGCVATCIRIGWIHNLTEPTLNYLVTSRGIVLLSSIELSVGLTCLSLATYKPLLHRLLGKPRAYYYYGDSRTYASQGPTGTGLSHLSNHGVPERVDSYGHGDPVGSLSSAAQSPQSPDATDKSWAYFTPTTVASPLPDRGSEEGWDRGDGSWRGAIAL